MVDATLILCPVLSVEKPHLGVAYLLGALQAQGLTARVLDLNLGFYQALPPADRTIWEQPTQRWLSENPFLLSGAFEHYIGPYAAALATNESGVIGVSLYSNNFLFVDHLVTQIKALNPQKRIVLGGPGLAVPSLIWFFQQRAGFDYLVVGEGEGAFPELIQTLAAGEEPALPGVFARGATADGPAMTRPLLINRTPPPDFDAFPLEGYLDRQILPLLLTRGCPFRCRFCIDRPFFGPLRLRHPQQVITEIEDHIERHGTRIFHCSDLLINGDIAHLNALCERLAAVKRRHPFLCICGQASPRLEMIPELFAKMVDAGFHTVSFGVESLSGGVLRQLGKPFSRQAAEDAITAASRAGLVTQLNLITGAPGEGEAEFLETLEALGRLAPFLQEISSLSPLEIHPGSRFYQMPERYGISLAERCPAELSLEGDLSLEELSFFTVAQLLAPSRWTSGGNEHALRLERVQRVFEFAREHGIPVRGLSLADLS